MRPPETGSNPAIALSKVLLPAPFGPINATQEPQEADMFTPLKASTSR
jgi:hypothetical protein